LKKGQITLKHKLTGQNRTVSHRMELSLPISDVKVDIVTRKKKIKYPLFSDGYCTLNQEEFLMDVEKVAWFYASGGDHISVMPYPDADENSISLYLNGSVYGAILHQRKVLPLHGSSFSFNGKGILICGESGTGKSSVTASFCINGAEFLSDDITPVVFENSNPFIRAMSDRLKLWGDSLKQLKQGENGLQRIFPDYDKFYYNIDQGKNTLSPLDQIFVLEIYNKPEVSFLELTGTAKFTSLRNEIYRYEYLRGMTENEMIYFEKLIRICQEVKITKVFRPADITIAQLHSEIAGFIASMKENLQY
jgi:hypothetical protein